MARFQAPPIFILEGSWWKTHEVPQILPFFQALATSCGPANLSHKTVRNAEDIAHWISTIKKGARSLVYIACHGDHDSLHLTPNTSVSRAELLDALKSAPEKGIDFLHIGCCGFAGTDRKASLKELMDASRSRWVSGYTKNVEWLRSTLLDLSFAAELFMPYHGDSNGKKGKGKGPRLSRRVRNFARDYDETIRMLGFSGLARKGKDGILVPARLHH